MYPSFSFGFWDCFWVQDWQSSAVLLSLALWQIFTAPCCDMLSNPYPERSPKLSMSWLFKKSVWALTHWLVHIPLSSSATSPFPTAVNAGIKKKKIRIKLELLYQAIYSGSKCRICLTSDPCIIKKLIRPAFSINLHSSLIRFCLCFTYHCLIPWCLTAWASVTPESAYLSLRLTRLLLWEDLDTPFTSKNTPWPCGKRRK